MLKVCGRLHIGKWGRMLPYLLMQLGVRPSKPTLTSKEAETLLLEVHTDIHSSALCHNTIASPAKYDLLVVIPVYNVEKYLYDCLQSVLSQKTKYTYHIVAVNDGSPDSCGDILKHYENDDRITVITQKNRGLSGARNTALNVIDAKFVTFLDSDDLFAPGAIESLLNAAYKFDADIVEGAYKRRRDNGGLYGGEKPLHEGISSKESLKGYPCMKAIKADLFKSIHFPEGYWYEDTIMGMLVIPLAKRIALIMDEVYYYTYNTNSISFTATKSPKSIDGIYITRSLLHDAKECGALKAAPDYQYHHFLQQIRNNWHRSLLLGPDIEQAMFIISCDLLEKYFPSGYDCNRQHLKNLEIALKERDFSRFRKTCFIDF